MNASDYRDPPPPPPPGPRGWEDAGERPPLLPHRGAAVLVLGILGLVVCFVCGIIAWVMGNEDLRAMRDGRMDPSGMSSTSAGRICGIVSTIIAAVGVLIVLFVVAGGLHGMHRMKFD